MSSTKERLEQIREAIRHHYGVESTWAGMTLIGEYSQRKTYLEVEVQIFDLRNHPSAPRCYAWNDENGNLIIVLKEGLIANACDAVHAHQTGGARQKIPTPA